MDDDEALGEWVDDAIRQDPVAQARGAEIAQFVECLRDACEPDVWKLFLELDRRSEERWADVGSVLLRYGFAAGRRLPRISGEVGR
jgi:hypothetical protein